MKLSMWGNSEIRLMDSTRVCYLVIGDQDNNPITALLYVYNQEKKKMPFNWGIKGSPNKDIFIIDNKVNQLPDRFTIYFNEKGTNELQTKLISNRESKELFDSRKSPAGESLYKLWKRLQPR